jgi:hypothetical protein
MDPRYDPIQMVQKCDDASGGSAYAIFLSLRRVYHGRVKLDTLYCVLWTK